MIDSDNTRKRMAERNRAAQDRSLQLNQDLEPTFDNLEQEFWKNRVPAGLPELFEEIHEQIEQRHNIKLNKQYALIFGRQFTRPYTTQDYAGFDYTFNSGMNRRVTTEWSSGEVTKILRIDPREDPEHELRNLAYLSENGELNQINVQAVGLTYFSGIETEPDIIFGFTTPVIEKETGLDFSEDNWGRKDIFGRRYALFSGKTRWFAGSGVHLDTISIPSGVGIQNTAFSEHRQTDRATGGYVPLTNEGIDEIAGKMNDILATYKYFWISKEQFKRDRTEESASLLAGVYGYPPETIEGEDLDSTKNTTPDKETENQNELLGDLAAHEYNQRVVQELQQGQLNDLGKDRVFQELQKRAKEDPNFKWPNSVSREYRYRYEENLPHERYSLEDDLRNDLNKYFPEPPNL